MRIEDLGTRFRIRRTAAGRTIASVAADAGLSVPYIANLENGRGNPTLSAVSNLAAALGATLIVELAEGDRPVVEVPAALPDSLLQFSRSARFSTEAARMAEAAKSPETSMRERLLHAMAGLGSLATRPLAEPDWHRILDAAVLTTRA
ncbi:helix-turn-helix domain-containing protein [Catellatospora citrea]|uniref:helix-turn-helix domain-containing protein n=1 Tax=Catellatospora citrea TaxID=53366 RepID=UPI000FF11B38|nr:helix-turn-helix transcriptional regulator [Catellatospora citrea]RKE00320.1 helix-turn-helix protein [Catellatospora citrea]